MKFCSLAACLALAVSGADLQKDLLFRATFDGSPDAAFAKGDKRIHNAPTYKEAGQPGLDGSGVEFAPKGGRRGGALRFPKKNTRAVYFQAAKNFNPVSGTVSFWLKLDPDKDLEPGFCDPIQVTDKAYNNSAIWVDFTKDERPRYFRLGVFGALDGWNQGGATPDRNPAFNNRLVVNKRPPFTADKWVHVAITYSGLGTAEGTAALYLDGKKQGDTTPIKERFDWDPAKTTVRLGVNYVGLLDDVALFGRPLTAAEVAQLASGGW